MFFDTNCFSEMPLEDIRYLIQLPYKKFITSSVLSEIRKGYSISPQKKGFSYVIDVNGKLKKNFTLINLDQCRKNYEPIDLNKKVINIKQNPILCSSYYTWLPYAINPALVTDPFRHAYNNNLAILKKYGDNDNKISKLQGELRLKEIETMNLIRKNIGKSEDYLEKKILMSSRKKRLKEIKNNRLKLTDYQTVVTALLYSCYMRENVIVITCDMDLSDIRENVFRSIIEQYSINKLLTKKLVPFDNNYKTSDNKIKTYLYLDDIFNETNNTMENIKNSKEFIGFQVGYYKQDVKRVFGIIDNIPIWLSNFVLEYKSNVDCISLDNKLINNYPIKYIMYPYKNIEKIYFETSIRNLHNYSNYVEKCGDFCIYSNQEINNPLELSPFIEK